MARQPRRLFRDTATVLDAYTGPLGEIVFDTTNKRLRLQDGATAGGIVVPKMADIGGGISASTFVQTLLDDANAAAFMTTLGITSFAQSLLDDGDAATARTTLGIPVKATGGDVRVLTDDAKFLTAKSLADAMAFVADTYAATYTVNFIYGFNRTLLLTGNVTFGQPTTASMKDGEPFVINVVQDGTGNRTIAFNTTYWKFPGGTLPTATTTAGAVDRLTGIVRNRSGVLVCEVSGYDKDIK